MNAVTDRQVSCQSCNWIGLWSETGIKVASAFATDRRAICPRCLTPGNFIWTDPATNPTPETPTPRLEPFPVPPPPIEFKLSDRIADLERALTESRKLLKLANDEIAQRMQDTADFRQRAMESETEIERLKAERQWQPIETAPKDGTVVCLLTKGGCVLDASFNGGFLNSEERDCGCWVAVDDDYPECWTDGACWAVNAQNEPSDPPTHWMPLPAARTPQEGQG